MKTRHTLTRLAIALSIALFLPPRSSVAAEEPGAPSFLKVGSSYHVIYSGSTVRNTVKILEPAGGQWFRVEVSATRLGSVSRDVAGATSDQTPYERWINFANVLSVAEAKEPPSSSGREKGAREAADAIAAGTLKLKEYPPLPYPPGHQEYVALLRERCGVGYEVPRLPPGVAEADFIQEVRGWNEAVKDKVKQKHGAGIFEQLHEEARKRWQEKVNPGGKR